MKRLPSARVTLQPSPTFASPSASSEILHNLSSAIRTPTANRWCAQCNDVTKVPVHTQQSKGSASSAAYRRRNHHNQHVQIQLFIIQRKDDSEDNGEIGEVRDN
ncbi:hypothetical protein AND_001875 [Anopheles darlingi]|uniref:Uncharacterized protein n=1 Tax=Anopheles darlingi TaxID=43151 RepID=W5JSR6_ANODA|nr:hypothetical protein AND_001875 [Anopheles darlingi]